MSVDPTLRFERSRQLAKHGATHALQVTLEKRKRKETKLAALTFDLM